MHGKARLVHFLGTGYLVHKKKFVYLVFVLLCFDTVCTACGLKSGC